MSVFKTLSLEIRFDPAASPVDPISLTAVSTRCRIARSCETRFAASTAARASALLAFPPVRLVCL